MRALQNTTAFVDLGFQSVPIKVETGLKEGSKLSGLFFDLVMGEIIRALERKHKVGLDNDLNSQLMNIKRIIAYADELTLMTESKRTLEALLATLIDVTALFGLKVNFGKSKFLILNHSDLVPNVTALQIAVGPITHEVEYTQKALFLGYGIKANKELDITVHLNVRNEEKEKEL